jgi:hypothetical protein
MIDDPHGTRNIQLGTPVLALNGEHLGAVRDVHPHFLIVGQVGEHGELEIPVHAVESMEGGSLRLRVNREALTAVDDNETAHRQLGEQG